MLTGEFVRLRAVEPSDAESLLRWNDDPDVSRWMINDYPMSLAQTVRRCEERPRNTYGELTLCIETLAEGRAIGIVGLSGAEPESGRAELDIYIGEPDFRGGGYGTDATRVICRYGFDSMRLHRISLWVVAENIAARRVYEKLGFVEEGRQRESFRRDGRWHDHILMGLLEGELVE
ncbi:Protein N-acetyltransferase, RimJ/RimL family [Amycolatopsis marina]|uniref:Protein N-acetyltransferase, RimJ/RimL family n=1 Tax=Amycolatopsis marina TaxID=490629 RepID=A0A1I0VFU2_9PSEU|nr:GNAT family protein [Amycolatopsis marina]SFA75152.1 Protein N-acetyltransferase, RimJ/RimL family [Amycolatopsis marina]